MEKGKVKELEARLREMFELNEQSRTKQDKRQAKPNANFVIRRRKGEQDKRIALTNCAS
ncbi:hypothetical protein [Desulfonema magnum]|uniref:Uncharacterized protein n=1 Tax=Desulfonema magnum TaxID=45655 RepID=A0A975GU50_9BACT|nr:hypothetical protein [Desulfonema magnum]QTA93795.1 Uncharacterized protein dnm_099030 [Desulfonema magnum]